MVQERSAKATSTEQENLSLGYLMELWRLAESAMVQAYFWLPPGHLII